MAGSSGLVAGEAGSPVKVSTGRERKQVRTITLQELAARLLAIWRKISTRGGSWLAIGQPCYLSVRSEQSVGKVLSLLAFSTKPNQHT